MNCPICGSSNTQTGLDPDLAAASTKMATQAATILVAATIAAPLVLTAAALCAGYAASGFLAEEARRSESERHCLNCQHKWTA
jgi:hypothetical protein